jgi:O-acetyl-ADP-ribose deacetylase
MYWISHTQYKYEESSSLDMAFIIMDFLYEMANFNTNPAKLETKHISISKTSKKDIKFDKDWTNEVFAIFMNLNKSDDLLEIFEEALKSGTFIKEESTSKLIETLKKFKSCLEEIDSIIYLGYASHVFQNGRISSGDECLREIMNIDFEHLESQVSSYKEIVNTYISEAQKELKCWRKNKKSKREIKRMFEIHGNLQTALNDNNNLIEKLQPIISQLKKLETELQFSQKINKVNVNGLEIIRNSLKEKKMKMIMRQTEFEYRNVKLIIWQNNLVEEYIEAIVNPTDSELKHERGASKVIAQAAGEEFKTDWVNFLKYYGEILTGKSMITRAGGTLCWDKVIHTVGPRYQNKADNSTEEKQLKASVRSILEVMTSNSLKTISIPAISTGRLKFPVNLCVKLMAQTIRTFIDM